MNELTILISVFLFVVIILLILRVYVSNKMIKALKELVKAHKHSSDIKDELISNQEQLINLYKK